MKKIILSFIFIFIFVVYATFRTNTSPLPRIIGTENSTPTPVIIYNAPVKNKVKSVTKTLTVKKVVSAVPTKTTQHLQPTHAMRTHMRKGPYTDGVYTGLLADAYYETFRIRIIIKNGFLVKAYPLPYQQYNGTSQYINNYAMPILGSEALSVQNANVNTISGATETSNAFRTSLASALSKAA